jgi:hypothetical protein
MLRLNVPRHNRGIRTGAKVSGCAIALRAQRNMFGFIKGEIVLGIPRKTSAIPGGKGFRIQRDGEWQTYPATLFRPCNPNRFDHWPAGVLRPTRSTISKLPYGAVMDEFGWPKVA